MCILGGCYMGLLNRPSEKLINAIRSTDSNLSRSEAIRIANTVVDLAAQGIAGDGEVNFVRMSPNGKKQIVKIALRK